MKTLNLEKLNKESKTKTKSKSTPKPKDKDPPNISRYIDLNNKDNYSEFVDTIYPTFNIIKPELVDWLNEEQYFKIEHLEEMFPNGKMYIVKAKKNIGKTVSMKNRMLDLVNKGEKFIFFRNTRIEIENQAIEWNNDPNWPFAIITSKGQIVRKLSNNSSESKLVVGQIQPINGIQYLKSVGFSGYTHIFYDEYVNYKKDKRGLTYGFGSEIEFVRAFFSFVNDFERGKTNIRIFIFGNNNQVSDPFTNHFKLTHKDTLQVYNDIIYLNLTTHYKGANTTISKELIGFDSFLTKHFNENENVDDTSNIGDIWDDNSGDIIVRFKVNDILYNLQQKFEWKQDQRGIAYKQFMNEYRLYENGDLIPYDTDLKIISFNVVDNIQFTNSMILDSEQRKLYIEWIYWLMKTKALKFNGLGSLVAFSNLVSQHYKL